ncbi:hypothetical protein QBC34DRAFT_330547 [Podospora aff. communis PSN243]|uniref:NmrA-like domain-containing protein n=1 Tax=Podospora aff. communis PSN243 TaxID=3040156 RepID=A0AAV9GHC6_9PEZI|nr:hypothetical protein QBC34DRAFT_330547 [Podospora aff. communis PSN243]
MPTIAVFGATGAQGGSVVRQLLKNPEWKVRGITRNVNSPAAKKLAEQGVELVSANANDLPSVTAAITGAHAVFGITFFWDVAAAVGYDRAAEVEMQQLRNMALALDASPTLQHFIISALPSPAKTSGGKYHAPHFDCKQFALDWVRENTPELWKKTTQFWGGYYAANMVDIEALRFHRLPGSEARFLMAPSRPEGKLAFAADIQTNAGVVVEGVLKMGSKAFGRTAVCVTDYVSWREVVEVYERVTGRKAAYVPADDETYGKLYGEFGIEFALQLRWSEEYPSWHEAAGEENIISLEELGVEGRLVGFEDAMRRLYEEGKFE